MFADAVLPHLDAAYSLAKWMLRDASDAEDAVQDACVRALKGIHGFSGGNARAWFLAIVRNAALTFLARSRVKGNVSADDPDAADEAAMAATDGSTPESDCIAKADRFRLESAIASLPLAYRETLVLRELHELTYREISEAVNAPVGTVMSRLARARRLLVKFLAEEPK